MIARIAVSAATFAIDKPYSYQIPRDMQLWAGCRVMVPFGRGNKQVEGVVVSLEEGENTGLKSVTSCLDTKPLIDQTMLQLAGFLRERCFCTLYDCLRLMLPAALWFRAKKTYSLAQNIDLNSAECRQKDAWTVLQFLQDLGGSATEKKLQELPMDADALAAALQYLLRKKWISEQTEYLQNMGDKVEKIATLSAPVEEALAYAASRPKSAAMQRSVLELMCSIGSVSVKELCYYTGAGVATVNRLEKLGFLELTQKEVLRCSQIRPAQLKQPLELNHNQQQVCDGLGKQMDAQNPGAALLHGVTGSGKTAVYIQLIRKCLEQGKSAVLLVPEIALTPQLLSLMAAHFQDQVAVQHSSLSASERYDQWKRIRNGDAKVVVGTRSAVFAPCRDLGMIIIDEEQEHSYKSENSPRYDAREVALWRGVKEKALVLFGSATPSIETMYRAKSGQYTLYTLKERFNGRSLPQVQVVDMRQEIRDGNDLSVSRYLAQELEATMENGKQTILFLNRRGNSRSLVCVDCGQAPECPRCNARLTYHSANGRLMCHYCGYSEAVTARCSTCGGPMKPVGTGTQKVEMELKTLFPDMDIDRMDADTVNAVNTHEVILDHFREKRVPVLLGTQMVAKGLDMPNVTLVGVLDADLSLFSGSYRAAETTFNMLTQVVGRAGRGDAPGQAVIQTVVPEHPVIRLAAQQDYDGFYDLEIDLRRALNAPPFGDLASITFLGQDEAQVLRCAAKFRDSLNNCLKDAAYGGENCQILGPAPCAVPKINYNFRYRLTLRCHMTRQLRLVIAHMLRQFMGDRGSRGVSAFVDVNGLEE